MQKQHPIATWNQEKDYWEEEQVDIFGHSVAYSATLPKSGMTRRGRLYERPMLAHPIIVPECSSSPGQVLPTPRTTDATNSMTAPSAMKHVADGFGSLPEVIGAKLLPTPTSSDYKRDTSAPSNLARKSPSLTVVEKHFPTPSARDGSSGGGQHPDKRRAGGHTVNLTDAVMVFTGETMPPLFDVGSV